MSDSEQEDWMEDEDAEEEDGSDAQAGGGDNSASEGVTDYGGATDNETDFESDYEAPFDEILDAPGLLDTLQDTGGMQPFEKFREERRTAREQRLRMASEQAGPSTSAAARPKEPNPFDDEDSDEDDEDETLDFRAGRNQGGQGKRARKRRPTHISRGELPPQGIEMMTRANLAFARGGSQEATEQLMECIKAYPNFVEPYTTLAAVNADMGLQARALNCYIIAAHMKPSDAIIVQNTAALSMDQGLFKQAIWAWSKYIKLKPKNHHAQMQLMEAFSEHISALDSMGQPVTNLANRAQRATRKLLDIFPGDPSASQKMPWFLYKMGKPERAIKFLAEFIAHFPAAVEPTHINMLAQLHIERKHHDRALLVMSETLGAAACLGHIDLAVKMAICQFHLGDTPAALRASESLLDFSATDYHDLYVEVMTAMVTTGNERHALPLAQAFITTMKVELEATRGGIEDGSEAAASEAALQTCSRLAEGLPAVHAACKANDDTATALTAYRLLYEYLPADSLDFAEHALQLVALLLQHEEQVEAQEVLDRLEASAAALPALTLDIQARRAETHMLAGNDEAFKQVMCSLLENELHQDAQERSQLEVAMQGVSINLRKRIERMRRGTLPKSTLAAIRASTSQGAASTSHAATVAAAAAEAAAAAAGGEDEFSVLGHPDLDGRARKGRDRRSKKVQALDREAAALISAYSDVDSDGEALVGRRDRLRRLMHNPQLFDMAYRARGIAQALEISLDDGEFESASKNVTGLLSHFPKKVTQAPLLHHKAALLMLALRCRVQQGDKFLTATDQKQIFTAWPYSVCAWSIFCRWCQKQGCVPMRLVQKLRGLHESSLPLMMLRGHALLSSNQAGNALFQYFQAFEMLPDDLLVNLCIAVAYMAHAMSKSTGERHSCIIKSFAFFSRYASVTANKQEAAYNLGRAMQQLGFKNLAVEWYERVLHMTEAPVGCALESNCDLRHEAAHNLCLIYNASGAHTLAARVMHLYCVI